MAPSVSAELRRFLGVGPTRLERSISSVFTPAKFHARPYCAERVGGRLRSVKAPLVSSGAALEARHDRQRTCREVWEAVAVGSWAVWPHICMRSEITRDTCWPLLPTLARRTLSRSRMAAGEAATAAGLPAERKAALQRLSRSFQPWTLAAAGRERGADWRRVQQSASQEYAQHDRS